MTTRLNRMIEWMENASALDPVAEKAGAVGRWALRPGALRNILSGTAIGHPVHPAVMLLPSGCWLAATVLDTSAQASYRPAATRLTGVGAVAAIPAALTGANDWLDTTGAERRVGVIHASTNYVGLAFAVSSWGARRAGRHGLGIVLSAAGNAALLAAGWLGGHLAHARGVGVDTTAFQVAPADWTDTVAEENVSQGALTGAHAGDVPILLTRRGGRVIALADRCTHRGGPLHQGELDGDCVSCPWHGSAFDVRDGAVKRGPATRPQPSYDVRVIGGRVQVRRGNEPGSLRSNPT